MHAMPQRMHSMTHHEQHDDVVVRLRGKGRGGLGCRLGGGVAPDEEAANQAGNVVGHGVNAGAAGGEAQGFGG